MTNANEITGETVAVKSIGGGMVHAGARSANDLGWGSACNGRWIGSDYEVITESASHVTCARCLAKLGRSSLN